MEYWFHSQLSIFNKQASTFLQTLRSLQLDFKLGLSKVHLEQKQV